MKVISYSGEVLSTLTGFTGALDIQETVRNTGLVDNVDSLPNQLLHSALSFHGQVFEFNTGEGIITQDNVDSYKKAFNAKPCSEFTSTVTLQEFEEWVESQKSRFTKVNYHMVCNNCTHFLFNACEFLDIPKPEVFIKQQEFLEQNKTTIETAIPLLQESRAQRVGGQEGPSTSRTTPPTDPR